MIRLRSQAVLVLGYATFVAALPFVLPSVSLATEVMIFSIAVLGSNLLLAYGGLLSFGQGVFFGLAAYVAGWYAMDGGSALAAVGLGAVVGTTMALAVGALALRRGSIAFLMITLATAQVAYFAASAMPAVTGGENGMLGIPRPPLLLAHWLRIGTAEPWHFYLLAALVLLLAVIGVDRLTRSAFGRACIAARDNPGRVEAVGQSVLALRLVLFGVSGLLAGASGALYALFVGMAPLSAIDIGMSERLVVMTILGGTGSLAAAALGAVCYVVGADILARLWVHWPLVVGLALISTVLFARGGLVSLPALLRLPGGGVTGAAA